MYRIAMLLLIVCARPLMVAAHVIPHSLFSDHMVLQQGTPIPVWGTASEGEKITVSFNKQTLSTITVNGRWRVTLKALPYSLTGATMTIAGSDTVLIKDVLVGEVWLCSGQSNMERQLGPRPPQPAINNWEGERDSANYPAIREYYVPLLYSGEKLDDVHNHWTVCSPQTVADFTAVGYFFAKNLHKQVKVPVGILFSAFGGTAAEDWISRETLEGIPELADFVQHFSTIVTTGWQPQGRCLGGLYNGMVHPLLPYAIKGVAWYQGESNSGHADQYPVILSNLIKNWRSDFGRGDFPFLIVQIAPHKDMRPEIREAQLKVVRSVTNTALIVTTDCGDANDIHPPNKQPVGERLAIAARALAYKQPIVYSGPLYSTHHIKGNRVVVQFDYAKGLVARGNDGRLKGFTIAGADQQFVPADAVIQGDKVIVSSTAVTQPVAVRYGWANVPEVNLYNAAGLPASPFRTDSE